MPEDVLAAAGLTKPVEVGKAEDQGRADYGQEVARDQAGGEPVLPEERVGDDRSADVECELDRVDLVQKDGFSVHVAASVSDQNACRDTRTPPSEYDGRRWA